MTSQEFEKLFIPPEKCKHNIGFKFLKCEAGDRLPGVWTCENLCGFTMNFNPEHYPYGVAYTDKPSGDKTIVYIGKSGLG